MRSPWPSAGSPSAPEPRGASTSTRGRSPSAASQTAGSAISSPSASRATISSTATGGSLPRSLKPLRLPREQALVGHLGEQALEGDAVAALDREGARDLALAGLGAGGAQIVEDVFLAGQPRARRASLGLRGTASRVLCLLRSLARAGRLGLGLALRLRLGLRPWAVGLAASLGLGLGASCRGGPSAWRAPWRRARRSAARPRPWSARPAPWRAAAWR